MPRLKNMVAIVSGGATGIGRTIVERFAEEGAIVVAIDIDELGLRDLDHYASSRQLQIKCERLDISDEPAVKVVIEKIHAQHKTIDVLINNAAKFVLEGIEASPQDWQDSFAVNVFGAANLTKYATRVMMKQKKGSIVNLASISGVIAQPQFLTYSTTKAAIIQMTKNLALDLGEHGIRVNCVSPGTIITSASEKHVAKLGITLQEFEKQEGEKTVLHKVGHPEDVANAVLFLASNEANFITGANLMIDGGYTII